MGLPVNLIVEIMGRVSRKFQKKSPQFARPIRWGGVILFFATLFIFLGPSGNSAREYLGYENTRWQEMCKSITEMAYDYDGDVAIYIKDLKSGKVFETHADRPFVSASLIKVPIMAATFKAIHDGRFSLDSSLIMKNLYRRGGSGNFRNIRSGTRLRVSRVLYTMISDSDNTAAAMLINLLGYDFLNEAFNDFGLKMTRINQKGMSLSNYIDPSSDNYTSAREMGFLLEKIYKRELVSDGFSDLMVEMMRGANSRTRLAQYLPENWKLARKTGLLRKNCHDMGIVFTPKGDYIICVLTGHNYNYGEAKTLIAGVGREVHNYFGHSS